MQANKTSTIPTSRRTVTKSEVELAAAEAQLAHDPERQSAVAAARKFKASWFELGEILLTVRKRDRWKAWGHPTFEDYCKQELHLKRETVEKLTGSYAFLQTRAPEILRKDARLSSPVPSYQAVDFLRRAEEEAPDAPPEVMAELRTRVLEEGAELPSLTRVFKPVLFPLDEAQQEVEKRRQLTNVVKRLRALLGEPDGIVTKRLAADLAEPLERLSEHLDKLNAKDADKPAANDEAAA